METGILPGLGGPERVVGHPNQLLAEQLVDRMLRRGSSPRSQATAVVAATSWFATVWLSAREPRM